jgi:hypothetical protein
MSDITKCNGGDCPLKQECYRHTAPDSKHQSYFVLHPFSTNKDGRVACDMFWSERQYGVMNQLKDILNGEVE